MVTEKSKINRDLPEMGGMKEHKIRVVGPRGGTQTARRPVSVVKEVVMTRVRDRGCGSGDLGVTLREIWRRCSPVLPL